MNKLELHDWLLNNKKVSLDNLVSIIAYNSNASVNYIESWVLDKIYKTPDCVYCDLSSPIAIKYFTDLGKLGYSLNKGDKSNPITFFLKNPFEENDVDPTPDLPKIKPGMKFKIEQIYYLRLIESEPSDILLCHIDFDILNDSVDNAIVEVLSSDRDYSFDDIVNDDLYKYVVLTRSMLWDKENGLCYMNNGEYEDTELKKTYKLKDSTVDRVQWICDRGWKKDMFKKGKIEKDNKVTKTDAVHIEVVTTPPGVKKQGDPKE